MARPLAVLPSQPTSLLSKKCQKSQLSRLILGELGRKFQAQLSLCEPAGNEQVTDRSHRSRESHQLPGPARPGRMFLSSGIATKRRINSSIFPRSRKVAFSPLCTCSICPRQRVPAADRSRRRRTMKVLAIGEVGVDSTTASHSPGHTCALPRPLCAQGFLEKPRN